MASKRAKSSGKSSAKSGPKAHGGPRRNAGRKPGPVAALRALVAEPGDAVERALPAIKARLIKCIDNLAVLADGGYDRDRITMEPAGLQVIKRPLMRPIVRKSYDESGREVEDVVRDEKGDPLLVPQTDDKGRPIYLEEPMYPHLPPEKLVVVSHSREVAEPDRAANQYLVDRILGKVHTADPPKGAEVQSALPSILERALERAYGGEDDDAEPSPAPPAIEV